MGGIAILGRPDVQRANKTANSRASTLEWMITAMQQRQMPFYARMRMRLKESRRSLFSGKYIRGHKSTPRNKARWVQPDFP